MNGTTVHDGSLTRLLLSAVVLSLLAMGPALAVDFTKGALTGTWDTTLSWGAQYRLDDPDPRIIGLPNGGNAFSVNGDDGNLNYDTGIFSNVLKLTTELELDYKNIGVFVRGSRLLRLRERGRRSGAHPAQRGRPRSRRQPRADMLDAFVWSKFDLGGKPAEIRVGEQVLSWGESTFIQGGINTINPVDVSAMRVPGAELREALLPEGMVTASIGTSTNTSLELFYQYDWGQTRSTRPAPTSARTTSPATAGRPCSSASATRPTSRPSRSPTGRSSACRAPRTCWPTTAASTARPSASSLPL